jgi:hypothetical protein
MLRACTISALLLFAALAARAQPSSTENVTVTGTKSRAEIQSFVDSLSTPTHMTGKIARWETPICPYAIGVQPEAAKFVVQRLKEVARQAGAPVSRDQSCKFNIEIVFTRTPQALLDNMKKDQPDLLGYAVGPDQRDRLAIVTHPIQGWYMTATRDLKGRTEIDSPRTTNMGQGLTMMLPCELMNRASPGMPAGSLCTENLPQVSKVNVTGARLGDGVRSMFHHIVIVADTGKLLPYELGAVSDYIAMLALTQLSSPDNCQSLPSIVNLLAQGCERRVNALTPNDIAYLRGLYWTPADLAASIQRTEVADQVERAVTGR